MKNSPATLGFDIDIEVEIDTSLKLTFILNIYENIRYKLFQYYNKTISFNDFVVSDTSAVENDGTYKTRFHIS